MKITKNPMDFMFLWFPMKTRLPKPMKYYSISMVLGGLASGYSVFMVNRGNHKKSWEYAIVQSFQVILQYLEVGQYKPNDLLHEMEGTGGSIFLKWWFLMISKEMDLPEPSISCSKSYCLYCLTSKYCKKTPETSRIVQGFCHFRWFCNIWGEAV